MKTRATICFEMASLKSNLVSNVIVVVFVSILGYFESENDLCLVLLHGQNIFCLNCPRQIFFVRDKNFVHG